MKKNNNYVLMGIAIIVVIIAVVTIAFIGQKIIPDNAVDNINDSDAVNPVVNNSDNPAFKYPDTNEPTVVNISGNFKINLKTKNPQYKEGNSVFFIYEIQNLDNKTLNIPKNIVNGIDIKDSVGTPAESYASSDELVILKEDINVLPLQKTSAEFSIISSDFGLTGLNPAEGSYYAVDIYIGNVKSNKAMVRILK